MKILTIIKEQLQNVVFLLSKNYLKSFYRAFYYSFTLLWGSAADSRKYEQIFRLRWGNIKPERTSKGKTSLNAWKLNNRREILKPTKSFLVRIYFGFRFRTKFIAALGDFFTVFRFLIGPYAPLKKQLKLFQNFRSIPFDYLSKIP